MTNLGLGLPSPPTQGKSCPSALERHLRARSRLTLNHVTGFILSPVAGASAAPESATCALRCLQCGTRLFSDFLSKAPSFCQRGAM